MDGTHNLSDETMNTINEEIESFTRELNLHDARIEINIHVYHNLQQNNKFPMQNILMRRKTSARRIIDSE
jgi:hypothetical protein